VNRKRTGGMTTIAILNFVFAGLIILFSLYWINLACAASSVTKTKLVTLLSGLSLFVLPNVVALIVGGIGILKLAPWGRTWTLVYAIVSIAVWVIAVMIGLAMQYLGMTQNNADFSLLSAIVPLIVPLIYPATLLYLVTTKTWKDAFSPIMA